MAKNSDVGLKQLDNGNWSCRIFKKINGVQIDSTYKIDSRTGEPFRTKSQARDFREFKIAELRDPEKRKPKNKAVTFSYVWDLYLNTLARDKAPATVTKHTSVWENHIKDNFGSKFMTGAQAVSVLEINDYLSRMYRSTELSYHYIEGFLKVFYLLYGTAYGANLIDYEQLNKYTKEKNTRITMPPMSDVDREEDGKIETYKQDEIEKMAKIFEGTDLEPAFLIAFYCGLRESEIFGLFWDDIDFNNSTITVSKQLIHANGVWCISPVKTLKSKRVVDMPKKLSKFLFDRKKAMIRAKQEQGFRSRSNEIVMDIRDTTPVEIVGGDFVNRKLEDGLAGKLLTTNSLKFYGNKITKEYGFALKMHKLRKTNLTYLAENGASFKYLKEHAGHLKVETTLKYYIKAGETSKEQGMRILDSMTTEDPLITIEGPGIGGQETRVFTVRKSQWDRIQSEQRRKK